MNLKEFEKQQYKEMSLIQKIKWHWWTFELWLLDKLKERWGE